MQGIRIQDLFGHFNYEIILSEDGMTIITGPNGFGKSTIIQCLNALANSDVEYFFKLDFSEIEILSENKDNNLLIKNGYKSLNIGGDIIFRDELRYMKRVSLRSHRVDLRKYDEEMQKRMQDYRGILNKMTQAVGEIRYIKEQRLIIENTSERIRRAGTVEYQREFELVQAVGTIPGKLKSQIGRASVTYSDVANELDSTYPERLFAEQEGIDKQDFDSKIKGMQEKVEKLSKYGISSIKKLNHIEFKKEDARALKVYFEDFDRKYREYSSLIEKLDMFTDIVNRRFRFKKIEISNESGVEVIDESGGNIDLQKLSSGEQETLVLFYQLLFEVPDQVLLLVDEPEISLHVAWQRMFIEDLRMIAERKCSKVIVATHSPQIVNGHREIQRDLGEMYKNGFNQGE